MAYKVIKGKPDSFKRFGRKRIIAIIKDKEGRQYSVRSLDPDVKQDIIHINGGSGGFWDQYNTTLGLYFNNDYEVIAEREYIKLS